MTRPHVELSGGRWHLWRLADEEFAALGQHALPIEQNFALLAELHRERTFTRVHLSLGVALTVLELKFGPSSSLFDNYRSSFSFPLLLTIQRQRRISYLLRCHDHRGVLYFPMYRIVPGDPSLEERSMCHPPAAGEFSRHEMDEFVRCIHGYLGGHGSLLDAESVTPFYRAVWSDLILYGHHGSCFFERTCTHSKEFERLRQELDAEFGPRRRRSLSNRVETMIDRVIGSFGSTGTVSQRNSLRPL